MSIFDHPDSVQPAPSWRCPSCRTLQPETTRCWRCDEPAFTCRTCRLFRSSVADDLGYCADDPARTPLQVDEVRTCWESASVSDVGAAASSLGTETQGLFAEPDTVPLAPAPPARPVLPSVRAKPNDARRAVARRVPRKPKPPSEVAGRAAWVEPHGDALVEAPVVEPGKRLTTEVQRRRRRWFR